MARPIDTALAALAAYGVKRASSGWLSRCPAHEDQKPSLTIGEGDDGRVLLCCQAGCLTEDVLTELSLVMSDLYPEPLISVGGAGLGRIVAEYDYLDEGNARLYQVVRFEPKDFRQRRPAGHGWVWKLGDVRRVLYRLPELRRAPADATVFVVEGEKDADKLTALGLVATTNLGGAGKWRPEYSQFLRGRRVVILPDNDEPGAAHAAQITKALLGIADTVKTVRLPGLPSKGDVTDWLSAGGTAEQLAMLIEGAAPQVAKQAFRPSPERMRGERSERLQIGAEALSFGVTFLDHALGGMTSKDIVLIGAKTGIGKTALATSIALHNSQRGKRVHYFALEAEEREIERRMKFQIIASEYYRTGFQRPVIRYLDWYMGRLDTELGGYEEMADQELERVTGNMQTFYRHDSFTTDDFCQHLEQIKAETDLVILDHLHYVDMDDDVNENRAYKRTLKQIRDSALRTGKPVIVVAHVRKADRRNEALIPTIEDFHGSSDISKVATKAVMIAAAYDVPNRFPYLWNTYIQIQKCRLDSSISRYVAMVVFDNRRNVYEDHYSLGRLSDGGKAFAHLTADETPSWASSPG